MDAKVKCPICGRYFEEQYVTKRWSKDCKGVLMCDLCADHLVDYGNNDETDNVASCDDN